MERQLKDELNELSQKYLGTKSRWQKLVNKGDLVPAYDVVEKMVTKEDGTEEKAIVRVKRLHNGRPVMEMKRYSVEEVLAELRNIDAAVQASLKQKEAEKQVHEEISGAV